MACKQWSSSKQPANSKTSGNSKTSLKYFNSSLDFVVQEHTNLQGFNDNSLDHIDNKFARYRYLWEGR